MTGFASYAVNCSILLTDLPLLERPAAAKAAGYDAVEFWWPFPTATPTSTEVDDFTDAIIRAGVDLTGLNLFAGDMAAGERGVVSAPDRVAELRDSVTVAARIGERLGTMAFNALYGNRLPGVDQELQDFIALENLVFAAGALDEIGAVLLLEPLSGVPAYPLKTAADVLAVIAKLERAGTTNVRLLADLYHLATNGDDVPSVITRHMRRIGHVQIADAPGRGAPGTGELPLRSWIQQTRLAGYQGPIGLEYVATRNSTLDQPRPPLG